MTMLICLLASSGFDPVVWAAVAVVGLCLGLLLTAGLDRLLARPFGAGPEPEQPPLGVALRRMLRVAVPLAALATWWWAVRQTGAGSDGSAADAALLLARWSGHAVLFTFLAAAAVVDFRHRVVPDLVTVPGVLLGLAWAGAAPESLLPIDVMVPQPFAAPLAVPDVLGAAGGLRVVGLPTWLGAWPAPLGLLLCLAIWGGWWAVCTAPFRGPGPAGAVGWLREPRNLILLAGGLTLAGLWCAGGVRWGAVATMLVGLAVGGGMIWGVRAGASLAMGREAMGMGDVTLMAMIGAWLGWQACMLVLYCTVFVGLAHALVHLLLRGETEFPFGPSLCLATALVVLFWRPLWAATGVHLADPALIAVLAAFVIVGSAGCLWALRAFRERDRARP